MTESPNIILDFCARTDVGVVRNGNEDNFLVLDLSTGGCVTAMDEEPNEVIKSSLGHYGVLLAVSDGMGGALAGEVASRMAVETVRDLMLQLQAHPVHSQLPFSERLRVAIEQANDTIHHESLTNPLHKGLGATFTAVASIGADAYFAQVGDSRAYLIRRGKIARITKDQSLVQNLIDNGHITEEEAETHTYRNVILQALGAQPSVKVAMNTLTLCHQDILVVCSDGLSGKIGEREILSIASESANLQVACQQMVDLANERGGEDNITVVIARYGGAGLPVAGINEVIPQGLIRSPATPTSLNWEAGLNWETEINGVGEAGFKGLPTSGNGPTIGSTTRPLPPPPTGAVPFASAPRRVEDSRPRTNDLSDRRGPITAVFAMPESESASAPGSSQPAPSRLQAPLNGGRRNRPASRPKLYPRRRGLYLAVIIAAFLLTLFLGGTAFIKRQQNALEREKINNLNDQKQARISRLRDKLEELLKKIELQSADRPAARVTLEKLGDQIGRISQRLEVVNGLEATSPEPISRACDEIERELQKIEDELDNLQGLLRTHQESPVRI